MAILDVAEALDGLTWEVRYQPGASGYYVDGVWTPNMTAERTILAHIQPEGDGTAIQALPEAYRDAEVVNIYTKGVRLQPENKEYGRGADRIIDGDSTYRVIASKNWGRVGGYYKAVAVKESK